MNSRGIQLSINMFVVLLLSIVILGLGFSLFAQGADSIQEISSQVDEQNRAQINRLLDDGGMLVMPFREQEIDRGDTGIYYLGIANELGKNSNFVVRVSYAGSSAYENSDPHQAVDFQKFLTLLNEESFCRPSTTSCASDWALTPLSKVGIENNDRRSVPIGISIPKNGIAQGQYAFNVDVCHYSDNENNNCRVENGKVVNRYGTRLKIYAIVR